MFGMPTVFDWHNFLVDATCWHHWLAGFAATRFSFWWQGMHPLSIPGKEWFLREHQLCGLIN